MSFLVTNMFALFERSCYRCWK